MSSNPLSMWHQAFSVSWLSNHAAGMVAPSESMVSAITSHFQSIVAANCGTTQNPGPLMDWQIAWGPVVYNHTVAAPGTDWPHDLMADNALVVASLGAPDSATTFIVGVAGTNFIDSYDWGSEDFAVGTTVPWSFGAPADAAGTTYPGPVGALSLATSTGITALREMTDANSHTLGDFLTTLAGRAGLQVYFAGHSLGGALAPTLGLSYLADGTLSPTAAQVRVLGTAGATPGDQDFANMFAFALPQVPPAAGDPSYCCFNTDVCNAFDVVPHAWNQLGAVPSLYTYAKPATEGLVACLVGDMAKKADGNTYVQLTNAWFQPSDPPGEIADFSGFVSTVLTQHIGAYVDTFGLSAIFAADVSAWMKIMEQAFLGLITTYAKTVCSKWLSEL